MGDFLIDKINFDIMINYVSSAENLKLFMTLLTSEYPSIQYDAFNVFKVVCFNDLRIRFLLPIQIKIRRLRTFCEIIVIY